MVMSPVRLGTKNHCVGEDQQQFCQTFFNEVRVSSRPRLYLASFLSPSSLLSKTFYSLLYHACYKLRSLNLPWCDHCSTPMRDLQIIMFLIVKFTPAFRHFRPLNFKYSTEQFLSSNPSLCFIINVPNPHMTTPLCTSMPLFVNNLGEDKILSTKW
jgi:hypothetical protein